MKNKILVKEIFRFLFSVLLNIQILEFFLFNGLANEENKILIANNFIDDLQRFLFISFSDQSNLDIFLTAYSLLITLFIFSSYWFNNPHLYRENFNEIYRKLFIYTTLGSVFFFYFFRIFNISRAYFIIYLLTLPLIFIFVRSDGVLSKVILRERNELKFVHIYDTSAYKDEIYFVNKINLKNEIEKIEIKDKEIDKYYLNLIKLQKKSNFDFILLNIYEFSSHINNLIKSLVKLKKPIILVEKSNSKKPNINVPIRKIDNSNFNLMFVSTKVQDGMELFIKRLIDFFFSVAMFILLFPVLIFLYFFIYFQDFQNPIIQISRSGLYGKEFKMYKFRTMFKDSHQMRESLQNVNTRQGPLFKIENDPRIISNLKWIRKFSLDELPQLINVIRGDMSLVGPRPLFNEDLKKFKDIETLRLCVLPGVTGLLQIKDRETTDFNTWVKWDMEYIENWSLLLDIKILFLTPFNLKKSK